MNYIKVSQAAEKWGLSPRRVRLLCAQNRIDGVVQKGKPPEAQKRHELVDETVVVHQGGKAVGLDQKIDPHGQGDEHIGELFGGGAELAHHVNEGVGHHQADHRCNDRIPEGTEDHVGVIAQLLQIVEGKIPVAVDQCVIQHQKQRNDNEQPRPNHVGGVQKHRSGRPTDGLGGCAHASSSSAGASISSEKEL